MAILFIKKGDKIARSEDETKLLKALDQASANGHKKGETFSGTSIKINGKQKICFVEVDGALAGFVETSGNQRSEGSYKRIVKKDLDEEKGDAIIIRTVPGEGDKDKSYSSKVVIGKSNPFYEDLKSLELVPPEEARAYAFATSGATAVGTLEESEVHAGEEETAEAGDAPAAADETAEAEPVKEVTTESVDEPEPVPVDPKPVLKEKKVVTFVKKVGRTFAKKTVWIPLVAIGSVVVLAGGTIGAGAIHNVVPRNYFDHKEDAKVVEKIEKDLALTEKDMGLGIYKISDGFNISATPLDVLKGQENGFKESAGENVWYGRKAWGNANGEALVYGIASAFAKDVARDYYETVSKSEVKYPTTVNHTEAEEAEGFREILSKIKLDNGSVLSESQKDAIVESYKTEWGKAATKINEDRRLKDVIAQAELDAKEAAEASAKVNVKDAILNGFEGYTVGDIDINWNTGDVVAWSPDDNKQYQYNGQSDELKGIDFTAENAQEEIETAINGIKFTQSEKVEYVLAGLINQYGESVTKALNDVKQVKGVKYSASNVDAYVVLDSKEYKQSTTFEGRKEVKLQVYYTCYNKNENTGATEFAGTHLEDGRTVYCNANSVTDNGIAYYMSITGKTTPVAGYFLGKDAKSADKGGKE